MADQLEALRLIAAKFKIGQTVEFTPGKGSLQGSLREYKIVRLLPRERGEQEYRIKSVAEVFERIARESELSKP